MTGRGAVIIGAGPAGMRAALALVEAGCRPLVLDESPQSGGQIFRRPPPARNRGATRLYGFDADRAQTLHEAFDARKPDMDYRPGTTVWSVENGHLHATQDGRSLRLPWSRAILASGAMDRILPLPGWTAPGCYSLGAAQIALKAQATLIGRRAVFFGTGPLLYLVAYQYAAAGADVRAVLDTRPHGSTLRALPGLASDPGTLLKGMVYVAALRARRIPVHVGIEPLAVLAGGDGGVRAVAYRDRKGRDRRIDCDAAAFGYGLRSETQIADLLGLAFSFDDRQRQWLPVQDAQGRSSRPDVYLAGDGARVRGAHVAELTGERAALLLLQDEGDATVAGRIAALSRKIDKAEPSRRAIDETAFPYPHQLAAATPDDVMVCRCEGLTAGQIRVIAAETGANEINRLKALSRVGMGRCQGRVCGAAAAEILAAATDRPIEAVGRLRGQAPIKPVPLGILAGAAS